MLGVGKLFPQPAFTKAAALELQQSGGKVRGAAASQAGARKKTERAAERTDERFNKYAQGGNKNQKCGTE